MGIAISIELPRHVYQYPVCQQWTTKVHSLKWFERMTVIFYKPRRYAYVCGKCFAEKASFIERYQCFTKKANQALSIRVIKAKTFKEAAEIMDISSTTVIRCFKEMAHKEMVKGVQLTKAIGIDEYKGDIDTGRYQLIIANAESKEPIYILPNRRKESIEDYLKRYGSGGNRSDGYESCL